MVVFHLCSSYLKSDGTSLKSTLHQERDPTSFEEEGKTSRMFEVTFVVPNLHALKPNWRLLSARLHWAEVGESHSRSVFLRQTKAATESLQKSPHPTELFLAGLWLPWELTPAIESLSIHWHILWNTNLFLYCTSFGHLIYIILCLLPEWYYLNWIISRTIKYELKNPMGLMKLWFFWFCFSHCSPQQEKKSKKLTYYFPKTKFPDSHVATETRALWKRYKTVRFITKSWEWTKHYHLPTYNSSCGRQQEKQKPKYHTSWMLGRSFTMFFTKNPQHNKQKQNPTQNNPSHLFVLLSSGCFLTA